MNEMTLPPKSKLAIAELIEELKNCVDSKQLHLLQFQFHDRFANYLYQAALRKCRLYPELTQLDQDIVQETFLTAFSLIHEFDLSQESDSSKHEYIVKAWLGRIANNCFLKEYSKRKNEATLIDYIDNLSVYSETYITEGDTETEINNEFSQMLQEALEHLNEEHKTIILEYAREGCINTNSHLSKGKMDYLCKLYNTTPENIRQIKKRALDKLKKYCTQPRR